MVAQRRLVRLERRIGVGEVKDIDHLVRTRHNHGVVLDVHGIHACGVCVRECVRARARVRVRVRVCVCVCLCLFVCVCVVCVVLERESERLTL